jgi:hypothetical protein
MRAPEPRSSAVIPVPHCPYVTSAMSYLWAPREINKRPLKLAAVDFLSRNEAVSFPRPTCPRYMAKYRAQLEPVTKTHAAAAQIGARLLSPIAALRMPTIRR